MDGMYEATVEATDPIATSTVALPFAADTRGAEAADRPAEPAPDLGQRAGSPDTRFGTRSLVYDARVAGTALVSKAPRLGIVRAVAWDPAGNKSIPASKR